MLVMSNAKLHKRGLPTYLDVCERNHKDPFYILLSTWKNHTLLEMYRRQVMVAADFYRCRITSSTLFVTMSQ